MQVRMEYAKNVLRTVTIAQTVPLVRSAEKASSSSSRSASLPVRADMLFPRILRPARSALNPASPACLDSNALPASRH